MCMYICSIVASYIYIHIDIDIDIDIKIDIDILYEVTTEWKQFEWRV